MLMPVIMLLVLVIVVAVIFLPMINSLATQMNNIDCSTMPSGGWQSHCISAKNAASNAGWVVILIIPVFIILAIVNYITRGSSDDEISTLRKTNSDNVKVSSIRYNEKIDDQFMGD